MLSVEEARARVLAAVDPLPTSDVLLRDALGRVLAADAVAPHDLPRFDNSAMDGFAVRGQDTSDASETAPVELEIVGEVRAGDPADFKVLPGTACWIFTGAPLPAGADAVVPVEDTEQRDRHVVVKTSVTEGKHVRPAGDDVAAGQRVVPAGTELGAGELALLASLGLSPISVYDRPRVALVVTGDEMVPPEATPKPGQIRDSNSLALTALIEEAGGEVVLQRVVGDDRDATVQALSEAARLANLVVSSGGVAVGKYDYVKEVVEELGHIDLWKVAMQPGKPVVLGDVKGTPFLGLPGNPVSVHIGCEQFVRPAIRKMRGCSQLLRPVISARLTEPISKSPGRLHFVRVRLRAAESGWEATPTGPQGSHIQSSLVGCHGVGRFPAFAAEMAAGDAIEVEVWRLPEGEHVETS
ncbi:MAG TPA: gephyrin-like molybdotransferase Glp [Actinomycetota bacterium]|nr:gephyrin-like molybdotransferase Glp [Actinomycetota bacterium]